MRSERFWLRFSSDGGILFTTVALTLLSLPTASAEPPPASQPAEWVAFARDGIEVIDCVQINAGPCRSQIAVLPDGSSVRILEGTDPGPLADNVMLEILAAAKANRRDMLLRGVKLTAEQWDELARIAEQTADAPDVAGPLAYSGWSLGVNWKLTNPAGGEPRAAVEKAEAWLRKPPGPGRDAEKAELVEIIRAATTPLHERASRSIANRIEATRKVLTDAQQRQLKREFFEPAPSKPKRWYLPAEREDGVYDGRVLLATYRQPLGRMRVMVSYGGGLSLRLPEKFALRFVDHTFMQSSINPEFLGGEASLRLAIEQRGEENAAMNYKAPMSDAAVLRACIEKGRPLSDFGVADAPAAEIGRLYAQVVPLDKEAAERRAKNVESLVATLNRQAKIEGADEETLKMRIAGIPNFTEYGPTLRPYEDETDRLRARIEAWWKAGPDRQQAAAALLDEMKAIADPKLRARSEYDAIWTKMLEQLTPDQIKKMRDALNPRR